MSNDSYLEQSDNYRLMYQDWLKQQPESSSQLTFEAWMAMKTYKAERKTALLESCVRMLLKFADSDTQKIISWFTDFLDRDVKGNE